MNIILFDDYSRADLFPLTLTRPVGALRNGILTFAQKWAMISGLPVSYHTEDYLQPRFPIQIASDNFLINGKYLPELDLWSAIESLATDETLSYEDDLIAMRVKGEVLESGSVWIRPGDKKSRPDHSPERILFPEDLLRLNQRAIESDFQILSSGRGSGTLSEGNRIMGDKIFIESGVKSNFATFNTTTGPIYLGKNVQIMEGSLIRGPFAILDDSIVKMATRIYGSTTIGPNCVIGGEIKNAILMANSRKGHEGYLGDSILGEWCNLGADTNNSNLKNNHKPVSLYNYRTKTRRVTALTYLGMVMGDYTKSGINASFNTGTVLGVGVNFYGTSLSDPFIPDFTWSESGRFREYQLEKMIEAARLTRVGMKTGLDSAEEKMIRELFKQTATYRNY